MMPTSSCQETIPNKPPAAKTPPILSCLNPDILLLQTFIEAIPIPVFCKDINLKFLAVNSVFERISGFSAEELLRKSLRDVTGLSNEHIAASIANDRMVRRTLKKVSYLVNANCPRGILSMAIHKIPFVRPDGRFGGIIGTITDVAEMNDLIRTQPEHIAR